MPSFRVTTEVRDVLPGHRPGEVLEVGQAAVRALVHLDGSRIDVVRGVPIVALRFTVPASGRDDEARAAVSVATAAWEALSQVASIGGGHVHRRVQNRWVPVGPAGR